MLLPTQFVNKNSEQVNEYHNGPTSKYYHPLDLNSSVITNYCLDLVHEKNLLNSRPWQCEIKLSIRMPNKLLEKRNFPGFFYWFINTSLDPCQSAIKALNLSGLKKCPRYLINWFPSLDYKLSFGWYRFRWVQNEIRLPKLCPYSGKNNVQHKKNSRLHLKHSVKLKH